MKTIKPPEVRPPWHREASKTHIDSDILTEQGHREACDINLIVKRQALGEGIIGIPREGVYADVTGWQGKGYDELLNESRETLDTAGRILEANQKAEAEAEKKKYEERQVQLEEEIQRLKDAAAAREAGTDSP